VWYVDNVSFLLDIKILWMTIFKVIKRKDIYKGNLESTPLFKGNDLE